MLNCSESFLMPMIHPQYTLEVFAVSVLVLQEHKQQIAILRLFLCLLTAPRLFDQILIQQLRTDISCHQLLSNHQAKAEEESLNNFGNSLKDRKSTRLN